ncbi:hypothetical protein BU23DRAFT_300007 [Bimuria novae-zelandiae CBS 107.79]|uniref:Uncharacterized protein n=1 Tax=Bimuria novae-zelandiae CBS 107.79 TaxID=1447943 RepID=A0A6A5VWP5_9PLEO|nr:hypothetical protein BU23DRAFT_300007 [Bimuria novae-zelandiae CBS 107.79]
MFFVMSTSPPPAAPSTPHPRHANSSTDTAPHTLQPRDTAHLDTHAHTSNLHADTPSPDSTAPSSPSTVSRASQHLLERRGCKSSLQLHMLRSGRRGTEAGDKALYAANADFVDRQMARSRCWVCAFTGTMEAGAYLAPAVFGERERLDCDRGAFFVVGGH